jgi:raffinose/stachyose/melibiose transport system substrate-binding protein
VKASGSARRALAAVGLAAVLVGAAACGTAGPQAGGEGSASAWIISGVTEKAFDNSFDSWNADHPDQKFATPTSRRSARPSGLRTRRP